MINLIPNFVKKNNNRFIMNILIIGATSGIGNNLWRHYCSTGNMVSVVGRRHDELDKMVNIAPDNTMSF